jgi:beta-glucosidase
MEGSNFNDVTNLNETLQVAKSVDVIILCVGEDAYAETPGDINSILLGEGQYILANEILKLNKKVIVVYLGGRPRIISDLASRANAVLIGLHKLLTKKLKKKI